MPKKVNPFENNEESNELMKSLFKKLIGTEKPKQKRVISEERRQQLREQLKKGRENSILSRTETAKSKKEPPKEQPKEPLPKGFVQAGLQPSEQSKELVSAPIEKKEDLNKLESKFDHMIAHLQEISSMQKETLEYKRSKKKVQEKPKEDTAQSQIDRMGKSEGSKASSLSSDGTEFLFLPKKKVEPPKTPAPQQEQIQPQQKVPHFYYVPVPKKQMF